MDLETLKVKILATSRLSEELTTTAFAADRVAESMQDGAVAGSELAAGMSWSESEASSLTRQLGAANSELAEGAAEGAIYAEGMSEVAQEQAEASATAAMLQREIDEVGDEALTSAAQMQAFESSVRDAGDSQLRANIAGISGRLRMVGAVAAAAVPPLLAMGSGLAGIGAVGGAGAAGAFGFSAAGLQSRAEEMARFSDELETAADAREQLMEGFMGDLEEATNALQTPAAEQFAMRNMQAAVDIVGSMSDELADAQPLIFGIAGAFREAAVETSPELFAAVMTQLEELSPLLMDLTGTLRRLPELVAWLGDMAQRTGPELLTFGSALVEVTAGISELGASIVDVALPPLNTMLFVLGGALSVFELLPDRIQNAAVSFFLIGGAAVVASTALGMLSAAASAAMTSLGALAGTVTILGGVLTLPIWAVAALGAGAVALASHFGVLEDSTGLVVDTWNELVDIAELAVNGVLWLSDTVYDLAGPFTLLLGPMGLAIATLELLQATVRAVGDGIDWLIKKMKELGQWIRSTFAPAIDLYESLKERAGEEGGVDLGAAKIGRDDDDDPGGSGADGGDGSPPAPPAAGAPTTGSGDGVTVDMSNSEFGGSTTESDVKQWVKDGVREANRASRRREDAQGG